MGRVGITYINSCLISVNSAFQVEGTFRVNTPPVLLGYHKRGRHSGAPADLGIISRNDTLLTLFVTIEPPLQPSQPMAERVKSATAW